MCCLHLRRVLLFWRGHHCWPPSDVGWPVQWRIGSFCQKCHCRNHSGTGKVAAVFLFQMLFSYHSYMAITRNVLWKIWGLMFIQGDTAIILRLLILQELIKGPSGIERYWQGLVNLQIVPICFSAELCLCDIEHICSTLFLVKHFILLCTCFNIDLAGSGHLSLTPPQGPAMKLCTRKAGSPQVCCSEG